jgi:hypothetical protein
MPPANFRRGTRIRINVDGRVLRHIPLGDLILQTELRVATELNLRKYPCPCKNCHGAQRKKIDVIRKHHSEVGRDDFLTKSMIGGDPADGYPPNGIWVEDLAYDDDVIDAEADIQHVEVPVDHEDGVQDVVLDNGRDAEEDPEATLDAQHNVQRQLLEALDRGDAIHTEAMAAENVVLDADVDIGADNVEDMERLFNHATTAVYSGSKSSILSATIIIMNMCVVFRVSNKFTDELLRYLSSDLLPLENKLPTSHYEARKLIRSLGLQYNNIHACPNGCVLYEEEHADLNLCPKCGRTRWTEGSNSIPAKVIRHFPLIPRLRRMFRSSEIALMLRGWTKHVSDDGVMRSVVDSPAWKHVNNDIVFNNFGADSRNLRLALALDGVNPFKLNNTNWSTWPILILIYNFEPWFVTKKFFISLCILISGKQSPTSKNIDVFLRPLLRELLQLWEGVVAQDFSRPEGDRLFSMRGLLMWTISDFPAYGLISGLCCKGYKGCPCCGPETESRLARTGDVRADRSTKGSKIVYGGIRRYLNRQHPYRRNRRFNGRPELRSRPRTMSGEDVIRYAAWRQVYLDLGGKEDAKDDPVHFTGVKRLSALYELPYWKVIVGRLLLCFFVNVCLHMSLL